MKRRFSTALVVVVMMCTSAAVAGGAEQGESRAAELKRSLRTAAAPPASFGNGIFQVSIRPAFGTGVGQFTVRTGDRNPAGAGHDVLYGQGSPGTSYLIVRDMSEGSPTVDYVQGQMLTHAGEVSLDESFNYQEISGTTSRTVWDVDNGPTIVQEVEVTGQTAADSRVVVSTKIQDFRLPKHKYQIQYLWDTAAGADDGPVLQPRAGTAPYAPFDPTIGVEQTLDRPTGNLVTVDNDVDPTAPSVPIATSGVDSTAAKYVCWADAIFAPLGGYVTDNTRNVSGPGSNCLSPDGMADSAVQYLWSADPAAGTDTVTASLRMSPPSVYPTTMEAGPISLGSATAKLTDTVTGRPIAGRTVTFRAGSEVRCTKITDAAGKATCGGLLGGLLGYDVTYSGGAIWAAATDHGGL